MAEKDQEKHQPVKNVDSQERATRKASVPPLQYQWRTSNLISLDLVICKGTLTSMCMYHTLFSGASPFAEPMFCNLPFQCVLYQRALYFVLYAIKHFNTESVQSKASVTSINILRNRIFLPVAKDLWVSTIIVILHNQSV